MKLFVSLIVCSIACLSSLTNEASAQTSAASSSLSVTRIEYTDSQLVSFGFTKNELDDYAKRLSSIEGSWWGHLSPMEMMMYSAKTESERRRFAKMYLTSNNPKAQAERKSAIAMYSAAREIMAEELTESFSGVVSKPTILFVNVDCKDCASEVKAVVANATQKVDIYVTSLNTELDIKKQLVNWASALSLTQKKSMSFCIGKGLSVARMPRALLSPRFVQKKRVIRVGVRNEKVNQPLCNINVFSITACFCGR